MQKNLFMLHARICKYQWNWKCEIKNSWKDPFFWSSFDDVRQGTRNQFLLAVNKASQRTFCQESSSSEIVEPLAINWINYLRHSPPCLHVHERGMNRFLQPARSHSDNLKWIRVLFRIFIMFSSPYGLVSWKHFNFILDRRRLKYILAVDISYPMTKLQKNGPICQSNLVYTIRWIANGYPFPSCWGSEQVRCSSYRWETL